jgi:hypothetical protein
MQGGARLDRTLLTTDSTLARKFPAGICLSITCGGGTRSRFSSTSKSRPIQRGTVTIIANRPLKDAFANCVSSHPRGVT